MLLTKAANVGHGHDAMNVFLEEPFKK